MHKEPGHATRKRQSEHDRECQRRAAFEAKPIQIGRQLMVEPMFAAPAVIRPHNVPADWKAVYHDPLRNRYVDHRGKRHIIDSDIAEAVSMAQAVGPLNQAMSEAYRMTGYDPTHNYASHHPWFSALSEFMSRKDWNYVGGGYFSAVFAKGDLVIKIGMKAEDSCAAYYAWVRDNPGLAGLPDLYHIDRYGPVSYTVVMRKYEVVNDCSEADRIKRGAVEGVSDTYERIKAFFQGIAEMDMHGENVMRCPDTRELIITDPVSFKAGAKF